jgi:pimeloyl-ACP methyl ester carboxylesterase
MIIIIPIDVDHHLNRKPTMSHAASAQTRYVEVGGARIAYRSFGANSGTPLVLCQRFRGTLDHWDPALLDVLASERPIVIFDNSGVGQSSGEAGSSIAAMAQVTGRLIDKLGFAQVDLLGWSMGGAISQNLTLNRPGLVRRLVLAGSGPGGVADAPRAPDKVWQVAGKSVNDDEDFLYLFFTEDETARQAGLTSLRRIDKRLMTSNSAVTPETVKAQFAAIGAWGQGNDSALARLGEISIPVLVGNGTRDIMVHAYNSYVLSQKLPNAQLILYPKAGHGFLFQYPELFGRHVLEFLR